MIKRPVAGKTGTTNDFTDAWFVGFTPNLATGVWVGFDDRRPLGLRESGANAALPIWIEFMQGALEQLPVIPFEIPDEILFVKVDPGTGLLPPDERGGGVVEIFAKGTEPTTAVAPRIDPLDFYRLDVYEDPTMNAPVFEPPPPASPPSGGPNEEAREADGENVPIDSALESQPDAPGGETVPAAVEL